MNIPDILLWNYCSNKKILNGKKESGDGSLKKDTLLKMEDKITEQGKRLFDSTNIIKHKVKLYKSK